MLKQTKIICGLLSGSSILSYLIYNDIPIIDKNKKLSFDLSKFRQNNLKKITNLSYNEKTYCFPLQYKDMKLKKNETSICFSYKSIFNCEYIDNSIIASVYRSLILGSKFKCCSINGKIDKTYIIDTIFDNCKIDIVLDKPHFYNCTFSGGQIKLFVSRLGDEYSTFENCIFDGSEMNNVSLNGSTENALVNNCSFLSCNLDSSKFNCITFLNCKFNNSNLENAVVGDLIKCKFTKTNVKNMKVTGSMSIWTYLYLLFNNANV